jgi:hypothetical protein
MQVITELLVEGPDEVREILACCPCAPDMMIVANSSVLAMKSFLRFSILQSPPVFWFANCAGIGRMPTLRARLRYSGAAARAGLLYLFLNL